MDRIFCRPWRDLSWAERLAIWTVGALFFEEGRAHVADASECEAFRYLPMTYALATEAAVEVLSTRTPPGPDMDPRERVAAMGEVARIAPDSPDP